MSASAVACVIPARLGSTRFPRKLLALLHGRPVIARTVERALAAECFEEIICLTDAEEIAAVATRAGCRALLCGPAENGTERIAKNPGAVRSPLVVNLQGDEPLFPLDLLRDLAAGLRDEPDAVHTGCRRGLLSAAEWEDPNFVKARLDAEGRILDFRRDPVPEAERRNYRLHLGVYGYGRAFLDVYARTPASARETGDRHELLRLHPLPRIRAHAAAAASCAIDLPRDLERAAALLNGAETLAPGFCHVQ